MLACSIFLFLILVPQCQGSQRERWLPEWWIYDYSWRLFSFCESEVLKNRRVSPAQIACINRAHQDPMHMSRPMLGSVQEPSACPVCKASRASQTPESFGCVKHTEYSLFSLSNTSGSWKRKSFWGHNLFLCCVFIFCGFYSKKFHSDALSSPKGYLFSGYRLHLESNHTLRWYIWLCLAQ